MNKEIAQKILLETEQGYDEISKKFSDTRKFFWRSIEDINQYVKDGDVVLDYGCGNGRLVSIFEDKNIQYIGADISGQLIEIAKEKYSKEGRVFEKLDGNGKIKYTNDFFDVIYSIAVFHHFPSVNYRQEIARELFRVTKKNGTVAITVWYLWQKKYFKNIFKNWISKLKGESKLDWKDCYITFNDGKSVVKRFHHAFTRRELEKLFVQAGFRKIKCEIVEGKNIVFVGKKENGN